ncbi:MAG: hypothetical protein U0802_07235 [Candidatus Binatia bacterium]
MSSTRRLGRRRAHRDRHAGGAELPPPYEATTIAGVLPTITPTWCRAPTPRRASQSASPATATASSP